MDALKTIEESKADIEQFFRGDVKSASIFTYLCNYSFEQDHRIMIRGNGEIIGVSLPDSVYHFYITYNQGEYYIKFKHIPEKEPLRTINLEDAKKKCTDIIVFVNDDHKYKLKTQKPKESSGITINKDKKTITPTPTRWDNVKEKLTNAPNDSVFSQSEADNLHTKLVICFKKCVELSGLHDREKEIIIKRLIQCRTLQTIADDYGISRERIRQLVLKSLRRIISAVRNERFDAAILNGIEEAFAAVPDINLIAVIAAIKYKNEYLWNFYENIFFLQKQLDIFRSKINEYNNRYRLKNNELCVDGLYIIKSTGETVEIIESKSNDNIIVKYKGREYFRPKTVLEERFIRIDK